MAKIIALDLGNVWTGVAISDPSQLLARPLKTVKTEDLEIFLETIFIKEAIELVVVGLPITSKAGFSEQTKHIVLQKEALEKKFSSIKWTVFNERFTSQQATALQQKMGKKSSSKEAKEENHALAAAFILDGFLMTRKLESFEDF